MNHFLLPSDATDAGACDAGHKIERGDDKPAQQRMGRFVRVQP